MKNIHTILSEHGITVPEDKKAEFDKTIAANYKTIAEHTKIADRLTAMTERAETAENTLRGFEGKDFDAITRERDEWKSKHDELTASHQREAEEREFNGVLEAAITEAKGRDSKAIIANLDLESLRKSKNQDKDIKAALDTMRTERGYLFEDNGGGARFTDPKGNGGSGNGALTRKDIMSIKDPAERQAKIMQNMHLFGKE